MSPQPSEISFSTDLLLMPQVRHFARRRYWLAALTIAVLVVAAAGAVRRLAFLEEALVQEARSGRHMVYELPPGRELRAPIEARIDLVRLVVHAYRRGGELTPAPRAVRLHVVAKGARGSRDEVLTLQAPGASSRVTTIEDGLSVGDPLAVDVDVRYVGVGEVALSVEDADGADGLLVRIYGREQLSDAEAAFRDTAFDRARKEKLAQWTWELGWDELSATERTALLATRWRGLGALNAGRELRKLPITVPPREQRARAVEPEGNLLGRIALRGDERVAVLLRGGVTLHVHSNEAARLHALVRREDGQERTVEGAGFISIAGDANAVVGVEIGSSRDALVDLRTTQPEQVEWLGYQRAWRIGGERVAIVESMGTARLLRIVARRVMDRRDESSAPLALDVDVDYSTRAGRAHSRRALRATVARSMYDRYEALDSTEAPSERAVFFAAVPSNGVVRIASADGAPVDIALMELDKEAAPQPLTARPAESPPPLFHLEGESSWGGFVARRPSNAHAFAPEERVLLRTAHRFERTKAPPAVQPLHVRPRRSAVRVDGRSFDEISAPFVLPLNGPRPGFLPITVMAEAPTTLTIKLEHTRNAAGVFDRVTSTRVVEVGAGLWRFTYVVGDDVKAGIGRLSITPTNGVTKGKAKVTVHMPWTPTERMPHWLEGQFEE